ncbi:MAG: 23S rRNA (adenine(2503)-C2)-methyltransferase, partial [Candidatus Omnitrophica bacterium]|nr:23S rRNA (adenine(2503)-C2)-methyltransferase [Candidatus Omnitrophota bacterium]
QITFEYLLADGLNAYPEQAKQLALLLKGMICKVNLIPLNPIPEFPYKRPSYKNITVFQRILRQNGIAATVRFSRGGDISAACGQLRRMRQEAK